MSVGKRRWKRGTSWHYRFFHQGTKYEAFGFDSKRAAADAEWDRRGEVGARGPKVRRPAWARPEGSVRDYAERWLARLEEDVAAGGLAPRTLASYRDHIDRDLLPTLGKTPLRQLGRAQVLELLAAKRRAGLSKNTVRLIRATLSALCTDALDEGLLTAHPAIRAGRRRRGERLTPADRVQAIRPMTRAQRDAFLTAAWGGAVDSGHGQPLRLGRGTRRADNVGGATSRGDAAARAGGPQRGSAAQHPIAGEVAGQAPGVQLTPYPLLFELLAHTGLRPGEAFALQVGDVDLARGVLHVERAWDGEQVRPTKTYQRRTVNLTPGLVERLRAWTGSPEAYRTRRQRRVVSSGLEGASRAQDVVVQSASRHPLVVGAWLLPNGAGHPLDIDNVHKVLWRTLEAAKVPKHRLYDLRHTYASLALSEGKNLLYVSQQLGHRDATTTLRNYARWVATDGVHVRRPLAGAEKRRRKRTQVADS